MTQRAKWAILGTGAVANRFATALGNLGDQAELVAVGSRKQASAEAFGSKYHIPKRFAGYEQVAADPEVEIVYIGTPHEYHRRDAAMCLEAGKHVLCEKAFTINAREASELIGIARRKKLFLMEAMWTRFFPIHARIRELLADGIIGSLHGLIIHHKYAAAADPEGTFDKRMGMGTFLDQGPYGVGLAYSLLGPVESVAGLATFGGKGVNTQTSYILKHREDRLSTVINSRITVDVKEAVVYGAEGKIEILDPWYKPTVMIVSIKGKEPERVEIPLSGYIGYEYEALAVIDCIQQGKTECEIMPLDETLAILKTMDTIRKQWKL
jgi:predicted dehydrogenase